MLTLKHGQSRHCLSCKHNHSELAQPPRTSLGRSSLSVPRQPHHGPLSSLPIPSNASVCQPPRSLSPTPLCDPPLNVGNTRPNKKTQAFNLHLVNTEAALLFRYVFIHNHAFDLGSNNGELIGSMRSCMHVCTCLQSCIFTCTHKYIHAVPRNLYMHVCIYIYIIHIYKI